MTVQKYHTRCNLYQWSKQQWAWFNTTGRQRNSIYDTKFLNTKQRQYLRMILNSWIFHQSSTFCRTVCVGYLWCMNPSHRIHYNRLSSSGTRMPGRYTFSLCRRCSEVLNTGGGGKGAYSVWTDLHISLKRLLYVIVVFICAFMCSLNIDTL